MMARDGSMATKAASSPRPQARRDQSSHTGNFLVSARMEWTRAFNWSEGAAKSIPQLVELGEEFSRAKWMRHSAYLALLAGESATAARSHASSRSNCIRVTAYQAAG